LLEQKYPSPFNPVTFIDYQLAADSHVSLKIFDVTGSEVAELVNAEQAAGFYKVEWDASKLSSRIYFYKLITGNYVNTKKMMLIK
jgi:hypothetical protein